MNKFKRTSGFLPVLLIVILSIPGMSENNNIIPHAAAATTSTLTVTTQDMVGNIKTGFSMILKQAGTTVATGFTPVSFTLNNTLQYTLTARGFGSYVFDHWLDTGSAVNPRTVSISTNTQLTAVYRIVTISLNPTSGPTGTTVTVTGKNFAANSGITISYDGAGITTTPTTITTDSTGSFTGSITVPTSSGAGTHTVKATDASNHPASAQFTVATIPVATISLNPSSGPTGTTVKISGSNFVANSGITISYDNAGITTTPTTITSTSTGSFTGSITIPSSSAAGSHTVKAIDASSNSASAQFTVMTTTTSTLTVTTQDMVGNTITGFSMILKQAGTTVATGFTPVSFTLNNTLQYTLTARGFGSYVFDHWLDTGSTVNPRTVSISTNTQLTAVYRITSISLNPSSGPTGTTVTVTGKNFAANSGITISYDGSAITTTPTTITTDSTGGFTGSITVPSSGAGHHTVKATDAAAHPASSQFTVTTPAIALNPSSEPTDAKVKI